MSNISSFISYPGLSAELVIDKNYNCTQFYELVSSCGVFCRMPESMQKRFLESIKQSVMDITGIIFVTDSVNREKLAHLFKNSFDNIELVSFDVTPEYNSYGLRVNKSVFTDAEKFRNLIKQHPNHLVLVSTPYSCPDLSTFVTNEDSIANRSSLFFFENKKVYNKKFAGSMNFIDEFKSEDFEKISFFFGHSDPHTLYFLKPLGEFVGGTTVLPLNKEVFHANAAMIQEILKRGTHYLFKQIDAFNIVSASGEHYGTQFRPFINNQGKLIGFALKFSAQGIRQEVKQTSLKRLSATYNSSSGTAISIVFECHETVEPVKLALSKAISTDNKVEIKKFLNGLTLGNFSLNNTSDLEKIATILQPKMDEIRYFFEKFFFQQEWSSLYRKFITEKTYFDED